MEKNIERRDNSGLLHKWQKLAIGDKIEIAYYQHGLLVYSRITGPERIHIRAFKNDMKCKDIIKARRKEINPIDIMSGIDTLIYDDMIDQADVISAYQGMSSFTDIMQ